MKNAEVVVVSGRNHFGTTREPVAGDGLSAPLKGAVAGTTGSSRYVRRCERCRQVRGVSGMSRKHPGVCRWCAEQEIANTAGRRKLIRNYAELRARESELAEKLEYVRRQIRAAEAQILSHDQPELLP